MTLLRVVFWLVAAPLAMAQVAQTGQKGLLRVQSAQTLGQGVLGVNTAGYFSLDNEFVRKAILIDSTRKTAAYQTGINPTFFSTFYNVSFGMFKFWDIALGLPYYHDNTGIADGTDNAWGDANISMKIQYPPYEHSHVFDIAFFGEFLLPTAPKDRGLFPRQPYYTRTQNVKANSRYSTKNPRQNLDYTQELDDSLPGNPSSWVQEDDSLLYRLILRDVADTSLPEERNYYGSGYLSFLMKMLWTFDASEINPDVNLKWHFNFGALFVARQDKDNIFEAGTALEWTPHPVLTVFTDFYGQARFQQLASGFDLGKEPLYLGTGLCVNIPGGAHIVLSADRGFSLNDKYSTIYYNPSKAQAYETKIVPEWGLSVSANWTGSVLGSDTDKDGIPDKLDRCPEEPEDVDQFEDFDGCPDNDNDRDGILDIRDKCPVKAEDIDNFEDSDGCPDLDNDKDGIPDEKDKCPNEPEDRDGFEDADGCRDTDNDRDGVPDSADTCPVDAEDVDGFEDTDGCPDLDNDKDGIPDTQDKCPDKPENVNAFQDEDGCPDIKAAEIKAKATLEGVNFKTGSDELTFESASVLDKVAESLNAYPDVCIEIRGHTDNVGSRVKNRELSFQRAESVKRFLTGRGIAPARIRTDGFGPKVPIASNATAEGRAKNRRIEMYRVNCQ